MNSINSENNKSLEQLSSLSINKTRTTNFRANTTNTLERVPKRDNVEIQTAKNKSKKRKRNIILGAVATLGIIATIAFYVRKANSSQIKQLAEHIEFKKANTIEEAMEFGKKNLGIKSYVDFEAKDLEVLNWFNEGVVNTSNKFKGKLRIPRNVCYTDMGNQTTFAGVVFQKNRLLSGHFSINKAVFNDLDKQINQTISNLEGLISIDPKTLKAHYSQYFSKDDILPLMKKMEEFKNGKMQDFSSKVDLLEHLYNLSRTYSSIVDAPLINLQNMLKDEKILNVMKKNGFETSLDKIKKLSIKDQKNLLDDVFILANSNNIPFSFKVNRPNKHRIIYHEMGHLQDMIPRVKAKGKFKTPKEYPQALKEWLDNDEYMQIASKVSEYSTTGPGEFIAETFAEMISGNKLDNEVMALYKNLKGPSIPNL